MKKDFKIILFYKYIEISNPQKLKDEQLLLCKKLNLKGRIIIAYEGINGTLEGTKAEIDKYCAEIKKATRFKDIQFKFSSGTGGAFPKLSVKVRNEIVAGRLGKDDIDPNKVSGKYLEAERLHDWYLNGKEFFVVDMRNGFEQQVGYFQNSINSNFENFDDLPTILPKLKELKGKTIVTVCTGGVRCEKASGFLVNSGYNDVYQLLGGMHTYMEKFPDGFFKGSLYVFDKRLVMGFNMTNKNREIIGRCAKCNNTSENYINCKDGFCHRHFIVCQDCLGSKEAILCPMGCRDYSKEHPEAL